ncbi:MAG: TRAP transporter small permease [Alphaproteobacteria bacterium]
MTNFDSDSSDKDNEDVGPMRILVAVFIGLMLLVGSTDVMLRYFFNAPLSWGLPVIGLLLGLTVFCGLPIISRDDEHITVGLLDRWVKGRTLLVQKFVVHVISIFATLFIAERMYDYGTVSLEDSTQHMMIDIPIWPFAYIFAALSLVSALYLLRNLYSSIRQAK